MQNGTSGDVFCEYMVSRKKGSKEMAVSIAAIVVGALLTACLFVMLPALLILAVIIWALVYFVIKLQKAEFEYTFTSGDLDIDKISGDYKRKHQMTVPMDTIEMVAPADSHDLDSYKRGNYKVYDFSANRLEMTDYEMVGSVNGNLARVIFTPNEKMIRHMAGFAPRKVKYDK